MAIIIDFFWNLQLKLCIITINFEIVLKIFQEVFREFIGVLLWEFLQEFLGKSIGLFHLQISSEFLSKSQFICEFLQFNWQFLDFQRNCMILFQRNYLRNSQTKYWKNFQWMCNRNCEKSPLSNYLMDFLIYGLRSNKLPKEFPKEVFEHQGR